MRRLNAPDFSWRCHLRGFAYIEVLVAVVLLGVLLVPAMEALSTGIRGNSAALAARQLNLRNKMETVLSQPFSAIYAQTYLGGGNTTTSVSTTYSDAAGSIDRRLVVFYRYSATTGALTASDTGLLFVSVYYEADGPSTALNTLAGKWW